MGNTRPTTRTLDDGDKVTHYPDGKQVLIPRNRMAERLNAAEPERQAAQAELHEVSAAKIRAKREAQLADPAVPHDKIFL